jgi:hypothetical protein
MVIYFIKMPNKVLWRIFEPNKNKSQVNGENYVWIYITTIFIICTLRVILIWRFK